MNLSNILTKAENYIKSKKGNTDKAEIYPLLGVLGFLFFIVSKPLFLILIGIIAGWELSLYFAKRDC